MAQQKKRSKSAAKSKEGSSQSTSNQTVVASPPQSTSNQTVVASPPQSTSNQAVVASPPQTQEARPMALDVADADEKKQLQKAKLEAKKKEYDSIQDFISSNTMEEATAHRCTINNTTMLLEQLETLCGDYRRQWSQMHETLYTIGDTMKNLTETEVSTEDVAKCLFGNTTKAGGKIKAMDGKRAKLYQTANMVAPKFKHITHAEDWNTAVAINIPAMLKDVQKVETAVPAFLASFKALDNHLTGSAKKQGTGSRKRKTHPNTEEGGSVVV